MIDLIGRMVARGHGGAAAAVLPLVRPLPSIYVPAGGPDLAEHDEGGDAPRLVRRDTAIPRALQAPSEARIVVPGQPAIGARAPAEQVADPPEPSAVHQIAPSQALPEAVQRDPITPSPLPAAIPARYRAPHRPPAEPGVPRDPSTLAADAPRAPSMTLEEIADAIFPAPPARVPVRPPLADAASAAARPDPVVTIGRIDIQLAEPAPPPRAAAPSRTRGFQAYARLRRGLER